MARASVIVRWRGRNGYGRVALTAISEKRRPDRLGDEEIGDALDAGRYAAALGVHLAGSARRPDRPGRPVAPERENPDSVMDEAA